MKPGVFITFDVECSMGGAWSDPKLKPVPPRRAVMGEYGDKAYGLPLITDILKAHNLKATFFVEAFMEEQGFPGQGEIVCKYLLDRGHDVQLHIHPNYQHYGLKRRGLPYHHTDSMSDLSADERLTLLEEGRERIRRWTSHAPVAFRAGNMAASEEVLKQVSAAGMKIDSSYTFPYLNGQCGFRTDELYNGSRWYGDVLELGLSGFLLPKLPGLETAKPLDLMGISFEECRRAIEKICGAGADAVMILHSFSLFKVRNVQYDDGRINHIVTRRFRRLCEWLVDHEAETPAHTFSQLATAVARGEYAARSVPPCRLSGARAIVRKAVQAVNNIYWV